MQTDTQTAVLAARTERLAGNKIRGWHHHAVRTKDMTATRAFYEGVLQLPLVGTWTEAYDAIKETPSNYVHCFFELGDGSALAFFQFEEGMREDPMPMPRDPYEHHVALGVDDIATVDYFRKRIEEAGGQITMVDHGYCYSCYTFDPNGMVVEISTIVPNGIEILEDAAASAEPDLKVWLDGVHESNNRWRGKTEV
ncbi:VOC family protein [Caballeronia mineralivorans]|jgi:catechol 2,3-dioxygenase-like lactoylglutathione lyase family enzyme|uniref:VOC family protein n=1 Tax=Caballeronia mineralivorans TaxID=2010198 RepID=UPI002AFF545C|nr:VOC family protein [Caballeronia mineralivorans]